ADPHRRRAAATARLGFPDTIRAGRARPTTASRGKCDAMADLFTPGLVQMRSEPDPDANLESVVLWARSSSTRKGPTAGRVSYGTRSEQDRRRGACSALPWTARRSESVEGLRLGRHEPLARTRLHQRPARQSEVGGLHRGRFGAGKASV